MIRLLCSCKQGNRPQQRQEKQSAAMAESGTNSERAPKVKPDPDFDPTLVEECREKEYVWSTGGQAMTLGGALTVANAIQKNTSPLKHLALCEKSMDDKCVAVLVVSLPWSSLQELDLSSNSIGPDGAKLLTWGLLPQDRSSSRPLKILKLSHNQIGDKGAISLATALQYDIAPIGELWLDDNHIGDNGLAKLAEVVPECLSLESLVLSKNPLDQSDATKAMLEAYRSSKSLVYLLLDSVQTEIGVIRDAKVQVAKMFKKETWSDTGATTLYEQLKKGDHSLKKLNFMTLSPDIVWMTNPEAGRTLAALISNHNTMETIWMDPSNPIGPRNATALASALWTLPSLKELRLDHQLIWDEGVEAIVNALYSTALETLSLVNCCVSSFGAKPLAHLLETDPMLSFVDLSNNQVDDEGAIALANALQKNSSLEKLLLNKNFVSSGGARAFAEALQVNTQLQTLSLQSNNLYMSGTEILAPYSDRVDLDTEESKKLDEWLRMTGRHESSEQMARQTEARHQHECLRQEIFQREQHRLHEEQVRASWESYRRNRAEREAQEELDRKKYRDEQFAKTIQDLDTTLRITRGYGLFQPCI